MMEAAQRAAVSFTEVVASFSEEQWDVLEDWQRHLYGSAMHEIHSVLRQLGYQIENSGVLIRIISEEEAKKRGHSQQEEFGPGIELRINYRGHGVEKELDQRDIKTEPGIRCIDVCEAGYPATSQQDPAPGLVLEALTPRAVKEEMEDGVFLMSGAGRERTVRKPGPWSTRDLTPEPTCMDGTRRRTGIARQIKSVAALQDQNKQTGPKENEAPPHSRLFPEDEPLCPLPASVDVYPISLLQRGQTFFICGVCGKYCSNSNFQVHMKTHTGERPYKCSHCDKSFIRGYHLKIHLRMHTGERPYKCQHCDKSFRDNSSFARHQKIHTGVKPHQCSTCGKAFRKKSNMTDHQRTHTGERPYKCQYCDKSFHQRSNHRVHERTHLRDS